MNSTIATFDPAGGFNADVSFNDVGFQSCACKAAPRLQTDKTIKTEPRNKRCAMLPLKASHAKPGYPILPFQYLTNRAGRDNQWRSQVASFRFAIIAKDMASAVATHHATKTSGFSR
jgi:hypothetical protein